MTRSNPINPSAYPISTEFVTVDSANVSSPTSAGSAANATITVPGYAAELFLVANQDIYISESAGMGNKYLVKANTDYVRGVGNTEYVYVRAVSADADIYFMFALIK